MYTGVFRGHQVCAWCPRRTDEEAGFPETGAPDGGELLCG